MGEPNSLEEFYAAVRSMARYLRAPAGKYRICMWDDFELYSSNYTFEEAMCPAVIGDYDDREEAIRIASNEPLNGWDDYRVYDDKGRYLGGNRDTEEPNSDSLTEACRSWRRRQETMFTESNSPPFTDRLSDAFFRACDLHSAQLRKGTGVPYISHLMAVASLVIENGGGEDEVVAALLHEAPEDQGGRRTLEMIRWHFGDRVAGIVDGCTDTYEDPKPPWRERKEAYLKRLPDASPSVKLVAAADKLHNARAMLADYWAIGEELWKRFNASKEDLLWYHHAVTEALKEAGPKPLVEELHRVVTELERLAT